MSIFWTPSSNPGARSDHGRVRAEISTTDCPHVADQLATHLSRCEEQTGSENIEVRHAAPNSSNMGLILIRKRLDKAQEIRKSNPSASKILVLKLRIIPGTVCLTTFTPIDRSHCENFAELSSSETNVLQSTGPILPSASCVSPFNVARPWTELGICKTFFGRSELGESQGPGWERVYAH